MSRPRRGHNPISLFPFLAVLVCVLGGLILLLVVNTRRMRMQGDAEAASQLAVAAPQVELPVVAEAPKPEARIVTPPTPTIADIETEEDNPPPVRTRETAEERAARERLVAERWRQISDLEQRLQDLDDERETRLATRAKLESLLEKTQSRLAVGTQAIGELDKSLAHVHSQQERLANETAVLDSEHGRLTRQMQLLRRELELSRVKQANAPNRYAFVPYNGKKGTSRRPILIECTEQYIRFLPEDVRLTPRDLTGFTANVNPLLTGVQTLSAYWRAWHRLHPEPGVENEPYVMLIVRPSGSVAYYIARKFLGGLNEPYGYELVSSDWELALPDVDPRAQRECQTAIEDLLKQRERIRQELALKPFLDEQPITLDQPQNRFDVTDVDQVAPRRRGGPGASFDPAGQVSVKPTISPGDDESDYYGNVGSSPQRAALEQPPSRFPASPTDRALVTDDESGGDISTVRPAPGAPQPIADDKRDNRTPFDRLMEFNEVDDVHPDLANQPHRFGDENRFQKLKTDKITSSLNDMNSDIGDIPDLTGNDYNFGDEVPVQDGDFKTFGPPSQRLPNEKSLPGSGTSARGAKANSFAESPSRSASGLSSQTKGGGNAAPSGPSAPLIADFSKPKRRAGERVDTRRWGAPTPDATIGFERELPIRVQDDRIVIGGAQIPAARTAVSRKEFEESVIAAIDQAVRSWPQPPAGFYWVPKVHFHVALGGNGRYEQLNNELRDLGLTTVATHETGGRP